MFTDYYNNFVDSFADRFDAFKQKCSNIQEKTSDFHYSVSSGRVNFQERVSDCIVDGFDNLNSGISPLELTGYITSSAVGLSQLFPVNACGLGILLGSLVGTEAGLRDASKKTRDVGYVAAASFGAIAMYALNATNWGLIPNAALALVGTGVSIGLATRCSSIFRAVADA